MTALYPFGEAAYPAAYRQEAVRSIVSAIQARQSSVVSSLAGAGKSHLLRFLASNAAFRQRYSLEDGNRFRFLFVDCNATGSTRESVLRALVVELRRLADQPDASRLQGITAEELLGTAKRDLDRLRRENLTLVVLLDRFEALTTEPQLGQLLDNLRHLRDYFARRISYILAVRGEPDVASASDEFRDLLHEPATVYLGPLSTGDARDSVARYEQSFGVRFDQDTKTAILRYSGGYARLLGTICQLAHRNDAELLGDEEMVLANLLSHRRIEETCKSIWDGLGHEEQTDLCLMLNHTSLLPERSPLARYGLVASASSGPAEIFSPVFERYVRETADLDICLKLVPPTHVRRGATLIWLAKHRYRLLECLFQSPGTVFTYDQIADYVYQENLEPEGILGALNSLVYNLGKQINLSDHKFIRNQRGIGYWLNLERGRKEPR